MVRASAFERFFAMVEVDSSGCWLWTGTSQRGYGRFSDRGSGQRSWLAHRWIFERVVGPIADGMQLDHLCRVRNCVNPDHLEPVTHAENIRRMPDEVRGGRAAQKQRSKTHCPQGHPYDAENTRPTRGGTSRKCRMCERAQARQGYARRCAADGRVRRTYTKRAEQWTHDNAWVEKDRLDELERQEG